LIADTYSFKEIKVKDQISQQHGSPFHPEKSITLAYVSFKSKSITAWAISLVPGKKL